MGQAELLIAGLLVAVVGLSALARRLSVPYPIVLVIGGALLGFVPGMPQFSLDPNVVLVVFLPLLVYGAAFFADLNDTRANLRAVTLSSVGLVLVTTVAVAVVAHVTISLFSGYAAFIPANAIGVSGVLAAVTTGLYMGIRGPSIIPARIRLPGTFVWEMLDFIVNASLFVLVGLQLRMVLDRLGTVPAGKLALYAVLVSVAMIAARLV